MATEFSVMDYFLTGDSREQPIVREVDEAWINENEVLSACGSRRIVFVERNLGDRTEAWVSILDTNVVTGLVVEVARWNVKHLLSVSFKSMD